MTVTDVAGCTNSDCVFVDFSIGINEAEFTQVNLYPNPSSGIFNIELTSGEEAQMDVLTISGQVIYSNKINGIEKIDLSTFAKGIYYLSIKNEKGLINRRLIIQ